jgi:ankyrin repeat protein
VQWLRANETQIKSVVKKYPNIESNYHYLLSLAASKGKLETVKYLVSIGADLNNTSKTTGDDALSTALWFNEYDVADWLIQQGMTLDNAKALESRPDREIQDEVGAVERYQTYLLHEHMKK